MPIQRSDRRNRPFEPIGRQSNEDEYYGVSQQSTVENRRGSPNRGHSTSYKSRKGGRRTLRQRGSGGNRHELQGIQPRYIQSRDKDDMYERLRGGSTSRTGRGQRMPRINKHDQFSEINHYQQDGCDRYNRPMHREGLGNSSNRSLLACWKFSQGLCNYGQSCRYLHVIEYLGGEEKAHGGGILCSCYGSQNEDIELFTGGADSHLKRWIVSGLSDKKKINIRLDTCTAFPAPVTAVYLVQDFLFCGLRDGTVAAFHRTSSTATQLVGHTGAVHALCFVEQVLVSGSFDGTIRFWKMTIPTMAFVEAQKIELNSRIICLQHVCVFNEQSGDRTTQLLWVGGEVLCIVDLHTLTVKRTIDIGKRLVISLVLYEKYIIAGFADGQIRAFSIFGDDEYVHDAEAIFCMRGIEVPQGPLLVCGGKDGNIRILCLPAFQDICTLRTRLHSDVKVIYGLSHGIIMTGGQDGNINFWKFNNTEIGESR